MATRKVKRVKKPGSGKRVTHKFTPETRKTLLKWLGMGAFHATACAKAGISRRTFYRWIEDGQKPGADPELAAFAEAVTLAQADAELGLQAIIVDAARNKKDVKAAQWLLEKRHGQRWNVLRQVTEELEWALRKAKTALPPEWYEVLLEALATPDDRGEPAERAAGDTVH